MKNPVLFTLQTPAERCQKVREIIKALLEAGDAGCAASATGNQADLKKAERATDRAISKAYKFMTGEKPPKGEDLVEFIFGEPVG
jgi:hypothetical protein